MKCTVIKTASAVTKAPSDRVEELKKLIAEIEVPFEPTVGDICFYDNEKEEKVFVSFKEWSAAKSVYPASRYTPIGVVTIPASHDVYGTGECAIVSLKEMNYTTPDEGSASHQTMYWGQYGTDLSIANFNAYVSVGTCGSPTEEATGTYSLIGLIPIEAGTGVVCPTDPYTRYLTGYDTFAACPSPYLADGTRNPVYYQTESPSSSSNALSDFDGVGNTNILCDAATAQSDWKTADTITNNAASGRAYSPAACCCWRYHTDGTSQGDWYLPACGEFGYLLARASTIDKTLSSLVEHYGESIGVSLAENYSYWSSTEGDSSGAQILNPALGSMAGNSKNYGNCVRAFLRV